MIGKILLSSSSFITENYLFFITDRYPISIFFISARFHKSNFFLLKWWAMELIPNDSNSLLIITRHIIALRSSSALRPWREKRESYDVLPWSFRFVNECLSGYWLHFYWREDRLVWLKRTCRHEQSGDFVQSIYRSNTKINHKVLWNIFRNSPYFWHHQSQ